MNKAVGRFGAALAGAALLAAVVPAGAQTLLGVYEGGQGWKMERVRALEAWQERRHAVVNLYTDWCNRTKTLDNLFNQQLPNIWKNGNVPMVTWEPFLCSPAATPNDVERRAAAGMYEGYLKEWARRMKLFLNGPDGRPDTGDERRVYLRLAHEMNGNWYPWSAESAADTESYKEMWKYVHGTFRQQGIPSTQLQWVWCANHQDFGGFPAEDFYPGDGYVDWLAVDGYNWGSSETWSHWATPNEVFGDMVARVRRLASTKPLAITEVGSTSAHETSSANIVAKSGWLNQFFDYVAANDVRMILWFNEDKETDWAVFGGVNGDGIHKAGRTTYKTYSAYKDRLIKGKFVSAGTAASNPGLLTDDQFHGVLLP
ncbi:glycoside hydrolase family 26 protein [Caldimonas tepidiphila]|uniref:glycoside hydrolase family 26 protein n=1 Tax=Caldimonas tepidiphila TaxID=2315841 RepID=UPI00130037DE|nr:glycosyl hydrolase [Caldimonas tepidiphila]